MKIPRPPTSPAAMHFATTPSKTRRKASLSRKRSCRARQNTGGSGDTVLDAELAEPAIGKVHLHLGAESSPAMLTSVNRTTLEIGLAFGISALFICESPPAGSTGSRRSAAVAANPAIPALLAEPEAVAGNRDPATVSSVQNPVAAQLIEGTERMKARTYSPLIVWGRASRMSDWRNLPCRSEMCPRIFTH
jgi:hypothetical protein